MSYYLDALGLNDQQFGILRELIHERTGIFFENGKRDLLKDKLAPRVLERGVNSFLDYYYLLKYDAQAEQEWAHVMDALSVQETYFWREMDQVHALVKVLLPQFYAARRAAPLRLWSSACATGEEPLSMALALEEAGWFRRMSIEIYASDASPRALSAAQRGLYRERSFRALPDALRDKYFTREGEQWRIAPELHARVQWAKVNLIAPDEAARLAHADVIFCRNVFIYFSPDAVRKTVANYFKHMPSPGYLMVGASESLLRVTSDFELQELGGAFVYVKR